MGRRRRALLGARSQRNAPSPPVRSPSPELLGALAPLLRLSSHDITSAPRCERANEPQDHGLSVDVGELLFWISPEVTTDFRLSSLTLLGTSAHIGCGRLSASMARTDDPATSGDGAASVALTIDPDGVVLTIMLRLDRSRLRP